MATQPGRLSRLTNRVPPADTPGLGGLLGLAVGVVIIAALALAREVLIPLTLAVLLSFVLGPIVALLRRVRVPKAVAVFLAALLALGVVVALAVLIGTQVAQLGTDFPRYASTIQNKLDSVRGLVTHQLSTLTNGLKDMQPDNPATSSGSPSSARDPMPVVVHQPPPSALALAEQILTPVAAPLTSAAVVFVVAIFILLQREDLRDRIIRLFGSSDLHRTTAALDDAGSRLGQYYLALLLVNTGFGVLIGGGLFFIGVPSPILWGILAGLLRFIPYIGSIGGAVAPLLLAAAVDPGWTMVLETGTLFLIIEPILGQIIEPMIYGHRTGLSPVSVVIAAVFWGWIWGGIGLLLSMPLTLCLVVLGKHIDHLEFLEVLLGDRPALSPSESLYQRMLAGGADEALEQAEVLIKERPLTEYYDNVVIPALQLAANDSLRGVLTEQQLQSIVDSLSTIVDELGDAVANETDRKPPIPAWAEPGAILCMSGRGALDEAVCRMLTQALTAHGLGARVVTASEASRGQIATLDLSQSKMVLISYIEGAHTLSPLRYLVRRLRTRALRAPLIVGLWGREDDAEDMERIRSVVGADHYARSLQEAVALCVDTAHGANMPSKEAAVA